MKKERMIEELAQIDGFTDIDPAGLPHGTGVHCIRIPGALPDYLNDHTACQISINWMDNKVISNYDIALRLIIKRDTGTLPDTVYKATPWQKCEAILKAYGKWEEEE